MVKVIIRLGRRRNYDCMAAEKRFSIERWFPVRAATLESFLRFFNLFHVSHHKMKAFCIYLMK